MFQNYFIWNFCHSFIERLVMYVVAVIIKLDVSKTYIVELNQSVVFYNDKLQCLEGEIDNYDQIKIDVIWCYAVHLYSIEIFHIIIWLIILIKYPISKEEHMKSNETNKKFIVRFQSWIETVKWFKIANVYKYAKVHVAYTNDWQGWIIF